MIFIQRQIAFKTLNFYFIFLFSILEIELIKSMSTNEFLQDKSLYYNEICSHNGYPKLEQDTNKIICICEEKYANEPREKYKKYINGQFIQCSYKKKRRFLTFFLAGICPLGLDYLYLGYYYYFLTLFIVTISIVVFNIISLVLNYKIDKKKEELKRQQKFKKGNKKFVISNITEINDRCVNSFSKATKVLTFLLLLFWLYNFIMQGLGMTSDANNIPTENDMGYLFEKPEL